MPARRQRPSLLGLTVCIAVCAGQLLFSTLVLCYNHPALLVSELAMPLVAAGLFLQRRSEGGWSVIIPYGIIMAIFWGSGAVEILSVPEVSLSLLLISLSGVGTYAAYLVFLWLQKFFAPERSAGR